MSKIKLTFKPITFRELSTSFPSEAVGFYDHFHSIIRTLWGLNLPDISISLDDKQPNDRIRIQYADLIDMSYELLKSDQYLAHATESWFELQQISEYQMTKNPYKEQDAAIVDTSMAKIVRSKGVLVWSAFEYISLILQEVIKNHAKNFIDSTIIKHELNKIRKSQPSLINLCEQELDIDQITLICQKLLTETVGIGNLSLILEAMLQYQFIEVQDPQKIVLDSRMFRYRRSTSSELDEIYRYVRLQLKNEISYTSSGHTWNLNTIVLDEIFISRMESDELTNDMKHKFQENTEKILSEVNPDTQQLAIICTGPIREKIFHLTKEKFPNIPALAYKELSGLTNIVKLGQASFSSILILLCLLMPRYLKSQSALFNISSDEYIRHLNDAQLAQNEQDLLPILKLDECTIWNVDLGFEKTNVFNQYLERFAQINFIAEDKIKPSLSSINQVNDLEKVFILFIDHSNIDEKRKQSILEIINTYETIVILKDLDTYSSIPDIVNAHAIIHLFNDDEISLDILSQQIFGATALRKSTMLDGDGNDQNSDTKQLTSTLRLGFAPPATVQVNGEKMEREISKIANEGITAGAYPGCQVLVARKGKVIFQKAYGHHTYDKNKPVQYSDLYDLASITKISSATVALMKLVGDGKFDLDAPLKKYFPEFSNSNKAELSWRQILAHNAQLKPWIPYYTTTKKPNGKYRSKTLKTKFRKNYPIKLTDQLFLHKNYKKKIYKMIKESPLNEEPGYKYSGLTFYLYPEIVKRLTGQPFENFLKNEIYHKLGANSITYNPLRFHDLSDIIPTERDTFFRMVQLHGVVHDEGAAMMGGISANAGLFSTTLDLAKLMQMLLNKGDYSGEQILQSQVVEEFARCQYCDEGNRRGLGFEKPMIEYELGKSHVAEAVSPSSFGHSGYTGTLSWVDPEYDLIYIFMSNRVYPTRLNRKLYTMNIRPRMQAAIYDSIIPADN